MAKIRHQRRGLLMIGASACIFSIGVNPVDAGPSVVVQVEATDDMGSQLNYQWRSTDGHIMDPMNRQTEWILPDGPGLHTAYVLVSNGKGGYTEAHITVNTGDTLSNPPISRPPMELIPPPAPMSTTVPFRAWIGGGFSSYSLGGVQKNFKVALPDVGLVPFLTNLDIFGITSLSGDFTFQHFTPPVSFAPRFRLFNRTIRFPIPNIACNLVGFPPIIADSLAIPCLGVDADYVVDVEANQTNRIDLVPATQQDILRWVTGTVLLADGSPCGTENAFFGVNKTATVQLSGTHLFRARANSWGQLSVPKRDAPAATLVVNCEDAPPIRIPIPEDARPSNATANNPTPMRDIGTVVINASRPTVMSIFPVTPNIQVFATVLDAAAQKQLPSDVVPPRPAKFLAMKGLDTRTDGCLYYLAIGAVRDCDGHGELVDPISFEDWKRIVRIDQYAPAGTPQYTAVFVNKADLNLTRDHHSVSYDTEARRGICSFIHCATAGYVCNYPGPKLDLTGSDPTHQDDVDKKIEDAVAGRNLVACVAMDYSVSPGVNGDLPFTRFLIFGPSGELLPSVNLDGLGEKFPPGTCVVCHGGNKYAGEFALQYGGPDLKAHFLPFDVQNMNFTVGKGDLR